MNYPKECLSSWLEKVPTWDIQDPSKLKEFLVCPRKYFYEYVLGWRSELPNVHLVFGESWHRALAVVAKAIKAKIPLGEEIRQLAFEDADEYYRRFFHQTTDSVRYPKIPPVIWEALSTYMHKYNSDHLRYKIHYIEIKGTVAIDERKKMSFQMDTVLEEERGFFSLEHKTTGKSLTARTWQDQWLLDQQILTYTHVLHCLFPPEEVLGVKINGASFMKSGITFDRIPMWKTLDQMQVWYWNVLHWLDMIEWNFNQLAECSPNDKVLMAFPMNDQSCTKYFGCPWIDFCLSWPNPLQKCDYPPSGFAVEHWNPLEREEGRGTMMDLAGLQFPKEES